MFSSSLKGQSTRMLGLVTANLFISAGSFLEKDSFTRNEFVQGHIGSYNCFPTGSCVVCSSNLWLQQYLNFQYGT
jgi:hypothetical protein